MWCSPEFWTLKKQVYFYNFKITFSLYFEHYISFHKFLETGCQRFHFMPNTLFCLRSQLTFWTNRWCGNLKIIILIPLSFFLKNVSQRYMALFPGLHHMYKNWHFHSYMKTGNSKFSKCHFGQNLVNFINICAIINNLCFLVSEAYFIWFDIPSKDGAGLHIRGMAYKLLLL